MKMQIKLRFSTFIFTMVGGWAFGAWVGLDMFWLFRDDFVGQTGRYCITLIALVAAAFGPWWWEQVNDRHL